MFEKASRAKVRFETSKGSLTVEDLWDLPLSSATGRACLDTIAKELSKALKNDDNVSFVEKVVKPDEETQLKFEIVKHIIAIRLAENEAVALVTANKAKKQHLLSVLAQKKEGALLSASVEEIEEMLKGL